MGNDCPARQERDPIVTFGAAGKGSGGDRGASRVPASFLTGLLWAGCVAAWAPERIHAQPRGRGEVVPGELGPEVDQSPAINNLLRRAEDAVARSDWKLAIDSLQRIIDEPEGLLPVEEARTSRYVSPRRHALRQLAGFPEEGLQAYRLLYDGRAKALLDEAREKHDLQALQVVASRYPLTRHGPEAVRLYASWLLDGGQHAFAVSVANEFLELQPPEAWAPAGLHLVRAAALGKLGDLDEAKASLEQARRGFSGTEPNPKIAAVAAWLDGGPTAAAAIEPSAQLDWHQRGGEGGRGRMAAIEPTMAEGLPWKHRILGGFSGTWPDLDGLQPDTLPVVSPVAEEGRLFAKVGRTCIAVDLKSYALLWLADTVSGEVDDRFRPLSRSGADDQTLLTDYVAGSLSASDGLVFSIDRLEESAPPAPATRGRNVIRILPRPQDATNVKPNVLSAYDAVTGARRWRRGEAKDPDERLQNALFLAPPVQAEGVLWVVYAHSQELMLGALNPVDGRVEKTLFLCAIGGHYTDAKIALYPAVADGFVYVPTGQGLLFAVNARERNIAWAARYRGIAEEGNRRMKPDPAEVTEQWLSGPPVIAGRFVLLAPPEDDRLLAFDRTNGVLHWTRPRETHRYVIGADERLLYLGGTTASAVSLGAGEQVWTQATPGATARSVLSGPTLYVPTQTGLTVIDAVSGELRDAVELPSDQTPLGNLLCLGDAMISVDPSEVRIFPDRNSYESTVAAHRESPTDVRLAIRLAFMELLNDRPRDALSALAFVGSGLSAADEAYRPHAAHLRVGALLRLGNAPASPHEEALAHLREAVSTALSPADRVATIMALGERLRRLGRFREACEQFSALAVGSLGDEPLRSGRVRRTARAVAAEVLRKMEPELSPDEREGLARSAREQLLTTQDQLSNPDTRAEAARTLKGLAYGAAVDGVDQAALNVLGRFEAQRGKHERAEFYLNESIRLRARRDLTADALLGLIDLYLEPTAPLVTTAAGLIDRIAEDYADVILPNGPAGRLAETRRARLDPTVVAAHDGGAARFVLTNRRAYPELDSNVMRMASFRSRRPESLAERVLTFCPPRTVRSYRIGDGSREWESELLMLDDFAIVSAEQAVLQNPLLDPFVAFVEGQTLIVNSARGLHALGTMSGNRLWAVPARSAEFFRDTVLRDQTTDLASGRVAYLSSPGVLTVLRAVDGELVWTREIPPFSVAWVGIRGDLVLTADADTEDVRVYALDTGESLAQIAFRQPVTENALGARVSILYEEGVLCGPLGRALTGFDARSGRKLWSRELDQLPVGLFRPRDGRAVVSTDQGRFWLLEIATGNVLLEGVTSPEAGGPIDGVIEGDVLVLAGFRETTQGDVWDLAGVDLNTTKVRWSRKFVGSMRDDNLRKAQGVIPIILSEPGEAPEAEAVPGRHGRMQFLTLIDKQTGQEVGERVAWYNVASEQFSGEMGVFPGRLVLQTSKTVVAIETQPAAAGPVGGQGVN